MLAVDHVCKSFGPTKALINVSFTASPGRVLAVVGENGSGKSTLMRILSSETNADSGSVTFDGRPLSHSDVFLVHQELALCPHLTVAENVFLGLLGGLGHSPKSIESRTRAYLQQLGYPDLDPGAVVSTLPISLRQVVEIARSQAHESPVVLFDEPTSSLTKEDKEKLFVLMARLKDQGKTVLFISHFLEEVRHIADDILVLRDGEFVSQQPIGQITDQEIVRQMVGRDIADFFPRSDRTPGAEVLAVEGVHGQRNKPNGVTLKLRAGEVVGIAGLNGAGRTELVRAVMKLDPIKSGKVSVGTLHPRTVQANWDAKVGFVSEDRKTEGLAINLSIEENLTMSSRRGFLARPNEVRERATKWAKKLQTKCRDVAQRIGDLSGGNQQKVAIARLLDSDCQILLLDEPTRGIDVGSKAEIYRVIDELASNGKAILIVSSYLPELLGICDRIAVMNRGVLSEFLPLAEASQERLMEMCVA